MDIVEEAVNSKLRKHMANVLNLVCIIQILQVYLHDLSIFRLGYNLLLQYSGLSPQYDELRGSGAPANRRTVLLMFALGYLGSLACHAFLQLPEPGFDGRLHGAIMVEFIGVLPVNRLWLLIWDTLVFLLQLLLYAMNFPIPANDAESIASGTPETEATSLLQQTALSVAKVMNGSAIIYTWDLPRTISYNWNHPIDVAAAESEPEEQPAPLSPSILPTAVPVNI